MSTPWGHRDVAMHQQLQCPSPTDLSDQGQCDQAEGKGEADDQEGVHGVVPGVGE